VPVLQPSHSNDGADRRLLFVVNISWFFISHRLPLAVEAVRRGWDVHLATQIASEHDLVALLAHGIKVHPISFSRAGGHLAQDLRTAWNLWRIFRTVKPTISHHVTIKPVLMGSILAKLAGVGAIVSAIPGLGYAFASNGIVARLRQEMILFGYRVALGGKQHRVIFQNSDDRGLFLKRRVTSSRSAVLIRGAGVDVRRFHSTRERAGRICVLMASRMLAEKGVADFIAAARLLRAEGVDARMVLAGAPDLGNPGSLTTAELEDLNRERVVEWIGHCTDMALLLSQSHIVCLPTYYGEGVPKVLIEAASASRAIVATDVPGCREVVIDGKTGMLVPPRSPAILASMLGRLIADGELRVRLGRNARLLVEKDFSIESVVEKTFAVYDELTMMKDRAMKIKGAN
jgi:glycosyltransferase involved in cell wall biosynthesis